MSLGVFIDIFLIGFTAVLLGYCFMLNRNIRKFNESKNNFSEAVQDFISSYASAEEMLVSIRETLQFSEKKLDTKINEAEKLFQELELIVQSGNSLADRLEGSAKKANTIKDVPNLKKTQEEPVHQTKLEKLLRQKLAQARR